MAPFRWRLAFALVLSWSLIYLDHRLDNVTSGLRNQVSSWVIIPIRMVAEFPTIAWSTTSDYFKSRSELIAAKRRLEEELLFERVHQHQSRQIKRENASLRRLVGARQRRAPQAVVAEIINTASLPFINRVVLSKGSRDGIKSGNGVFNDSGIIGRLTRVDAETSQALLLTDKRFWVATRNERDNSLVLLQGDGNGRMRIRLVPTDVDLRRGDVLVTAAGAGLFPAGLPVATVGATWDPDGISFKEGHAFPIASVRQDTALLVNVTEHDDVPEARMPVDPSGAVPANLTPDILP